MNETNNPIKVAMYKKVYSALGEVEHQIDKFIDNEYHSDFSMKKYMTELDFKPKLIEIVKSEYQGVLDELTSEDEQLIEAYSYMTKPQKKRFIKFVEKIIDDCDKHVKENENKWAKESALKSANRKFAKARKKYNL